jgi:hypothetical protein
MELMSQNSWDNDELLELLAKLVAIGKCFPCLGNSTDQQKRTSSHNTMVVISTSDQP